MRIRGYGNITNSFPLYTKNINNNNFKNILLKCFGGDVYTLIQSTHFLLIFLKFIFITCEKRCFYMGSPIHALGPLENCHLKQ